jgi:hypothetical protein
VNLAGFGPVRATWAGRPKGLQPYPAKPQTPTVRSAHPAPLKFRGLAQRLVLRFVKRYECASKGL